MTMLPDFASNKMPAEPTVTVADRINELFRKLRSNKVEAPPLAIATAYINPGGFSLLADELEHAPKVRLLLGAEPQAEAVEALAAGDADQDARRAAAIQEHQRWLEAERDLMGFERTPTMNARRMVEWLRSLDADGRPRVQVRRYGGGFLHGKAYLVEDSATKAAIAGSSNMTYAGLAHNAELNLGTAAGTHAAVKVHEWFDHFWEQSEEYDLASLYGYLWEPHNPWSIYLRMLWELYGDHLDEEEMNFRTGLPLTRFQADGVARMQRLLDEHGGVLVADEVGLGKTYLAGEVIFKTANINRQQVLVVAPAALKSSMWDPFMEKHDFSRWVKVYSYEEVRNKLDERFNNPEDFLSEVEGYSLVVIDEAHNLRNAEAQRSGAVDRVITAGKQPKKVILLTATPVNNSLTDLETLIKYFIRDDARFAAIGIPSIRKYIHEAQQIDPENLSPEHLFDLMDQVAVRRTRKFVKEHYANETITGSDGKPTAIKFPQSKVRRIDYELNEAGIELVDAVVYALDDNLEDILDPQDWSELRGNPKKLKMARYLTKLYWGGGEFDLLQYNNAGLLRSALLKRLESSPDALHSSLTRMILTHEAFIEGLDKGHVMKSEALNNWLVSDSDDLDEFLQQLDDEAALEPAEGFRVDELRADVESDLVVLNHLKDLAAKAKEGNEPKVTRLIEELTQIAAKARRVDARGLSHGDRRKVVIFTAFGDTIIPIHEAVTNAINAAPESSPLSDYKNRIAPEILGGYAKTRARGASGGVSQSGRSTIVAEFAPKTAGVLRPDGEPTTKDKYDLLFTTDVLAEGVNLQQAGQIINYDLPWNPMRIVQRHGRVDRIGSLHDIIYLGLFFPSERLDVILELESKLKSKLALANAAIGVNKVLPGQRIGRDVNLTDENVTDEFEDLLEKGGSSASLSGEEYRRRLFDALENDTQRKTEITKLPFASGSGFESPNLQGNGFVFCIRIGESVKPWFRFVPVDESWQVVRNGEGIPQVSTDTLVALRSADPGNAETERWLPDMVYEQAFDAWTVARDDAFEEWQKLTDPSSLQPDVPLSFRDAYDLVLRAGGYLGREEMTSLAGRLQSVPSKKVEREMRKALNNGRTDEERIALVTEVLDDAGIVAPPRRESLPPVEPHQVRLVAWMAVRGTGSET